MEKLEQRREVWRGQVWGEQALLDFTGTSTIRMALEHWPEGEVRSWALLTDTTPMSCHAAYFGTRGLPNTTSNMPTPGISHDESFATFCYCFWSSMRNYWEIGEDCVDHIKLWKSLQEMGIPDHLTSLLRSLYAGQEATVRAGRETTDWFQIRKGVHQGCILSPAYLNGMQCTSWGMLGQIKHKLESRLLGISLASDMQMTPPLWQKVKNN